MQLHVDDTETAHVISVKFTKYIKTALNCLVSCQTLLSRATRSWKLCSGSWRLLSRSRSRNRCRL